MGAGSDRLRAAYRPATGPARIATARQLVTRLPATLAALRAGRIHLRHAQRLADATATLDPEIAAAVEAAVLGRGARQTAPQFTASVRRQVARYDTRHADEQHRAAAAWRAVVFRPLPDGMGELCAQLPADAIAAIRQVVQHAGAHLKHLDQQAGHQPRTPDQRRADALTDLLLHPQPDASGPTDTADTDSTDSGANAGAAGAERGAEATDPRAADTDKPAGGGSDPDDDGGGVARAAAPARGVRPVINVTVALSTLLGLDEQGGELGGHGPIPAALARALAFDPTATWRRILTDDDGQFLEAGAHTYRPGAALDRHVRLRDETCRFTGCRRATEHCEIDHIHAWADGGLTIPTNTQALCARHHHLKHEAGWQVHRRPDGTTWWTAPTGHHYQQPPPDPLPIDTTMANRS